MVAGIGLDSDEYERPPMLFEEMFRRARVDGFKLTSHCDFNQKDTHEHIRQVAESIGGLGADRIDHGTNAADRDALIESIESRGIWMTIVIRLREKYSLAFASFLMQASKLPSQVTIQHIWNIIGCYTTYS
jgi:hypothetical protein